MDTIQINVEGWPDELVDTLKNYADQVSTKFRANGEGTDLAVRDLPTWPGVANLPPEKLRREELYRDTPE